MHNITYLEKKASDILLTSTAKEYANILIIGHAGTGKTRLAKNIINLLEEKTHRIFNKKFATVQEIINLQKTISDLPVNTTNILVLDDPLLTPKKHHKKIFQTLTEIKHIQKSPLILFLISSPIKPINAIRSNFIFHT